MSRRRVLFMWLSVAAGAAGLFPGSGGARVAVAKWHRVLGIPDEVQLVAGGSCRGSWSFAIAGRPARVFKAKDPDGPWAAVGPRIPSRAQSIVEANAGLVLVGTQSGTIIRITSGGRSRRAMTYYGAVTALAAAPAPSKTVYAGGSQLGGLSISKDGGLHWKALGGLSPDATTKVSGLVAGSGGHVFAALTTPLAGGNRGLNDGVYESRDGGATWRRIVDGLTSRYVSVLGGRLPQILTRDGSGNVFRWDGRTGIWGPVRGLEGPNREYSWQLLSVAGLPGDPDVLYAGTLGGGLFVSTDGGTSFTPGAFYGSTVPSVAGAAVGRFVYAVRQNLLGRSTLWALARRGADVAGC
jgi:hypothetical protein